MRYIAFLTSGDFWNAIKLGLDIIQSLVFTLATIIAGVWAMKTFGYDEKLRQLEKLNRTVRNLQETMSSLRTWRMLNSIMTNPLPTSNQAMENNVFRAQAELRDAFDTSMRVDFFNKMRWNTRLLFHMFNLPPFPWEESDYQKAMNDFNQVSAEIVRDAHFGLPKWLRYLSSLF